MANLSFLRLFAALVGVSSAVSVFGLAACGGAVLSEAQTSDIDANIAESSVPGDASREDSGLTQRPDASVTNGVDASIGATTDADDVFLCRICDV